MVKKDTDEVDLIKVDYMHIVNITMNFFVQFMLIKLKRNDLKEKKEELEVCVFRHPLFYFIYFLFRIGVDINFDLSVFCLLKNKIFHSSKNKYVIFSKDN
jgi:hypothetical protein